MTQTQNHLVRLGKELKEIVIMTLVLFPVVYTVCYSANFILSK